MFRVSFNKLCIYLPEINISSEQCEMTESECMVVSEKVWRLRNLSRPWIQVVPNTPFSSAVSQILGQLPSELAATACGMDEWQPWTGGVHDLVEGQRRMHMKEMRSVF